ncbi:DNA polymerase phi-domain-containing protein [Favolaschia claudopus]|uniref:DNA polymerase phi-domain-containing protein n=1 Tax=Favolaschia claudopus TaxID=2862362 RepID=A0AAW0AR64_9AGAR
MLEVEMHSPSFRTTRSASAKRARSPDNVSERPAKRLSLAIDSPLSAAEHSFHYFATGPPSSASTSRHSSEDWVRQANGLSIDSPLFPSVNSYVQGVDSSVDEGMVVDEEVHMGVISRRPYLPPLHTESDTLMQSPVPAPAQQPPTSRPSATYITTPSGGSNSLSLPAINVLPATPELLSRTRPSTPVNSDRDHSSTMNISPTNSFAVPGSPASRKHRFMMGPRANCENIPICPNNSLQKIMSTTLPLFWDLSSVSKKQRIDASVKLIGALEQFQAQFVPKDERSEDEGEDDDMPVDSIDKFNVQDVSYSIRRLIRGLASPRESSRLGFAVALTELLSRLDTVNCSQIMALVNDATKSQGSMTGQEERDVLFARLFGLTAIIQSGLIVRTKPLPFSASSETSASSLANFQEAITTLVALGEKKSWLRESAWWSLSLAIDALNTSDVQWKVPAFDATIQCIFNENIPWSPEKVAITLKLQNMLPDQEWRKLLSPAFKSSDLLANANLQILGRILKENATEDDAENGLPKLAAGSWKPQLHFVWGIILDQLLPAPGVPVFTKGSFQEFFRVVIDETLFSSTSSQERKYSGFQVFQKALPRVTEDNLPMLFTKNFMRSWINHLSHNDRYLHKVARQVATDIQDLAQTRPQIGFALILQLTGVHGSQQFDQLTKSKTIEAILASMNPEGIKAYITHLVSLINPLTESEEPDMQAINSRRAWVIDQLSALIRNVGIPKADDWVMSILDWLVLNGLFVVKKKSEKSPFIGLRKISTPPFSDILRDQCRNRLLSCLAELTHQTRSLTLDEDRTIKCPGIASDDEFWISKVIGSVERLKEDTKRVALLVEADEVDSSLQAKVNETVAKLRQVSGPQREAAKGAELLVSGMLLQYYAAPESDIDTSTLEDCVDASIRMFFSTKKKGKKSQKAAEDSTDPPPEPIDIMVDTIIGFLEKSTSYMRNLGNQVFFLLSSSVQASTVDLVLTQLERRDPAELAQDNDDSEEEDYGDEDGSHSDSDSDSSENLDDGSSDGEVDPELRRKIAEALRVNGADAASQDEDGDDDASEEELMDDEQMLAVDDQLAQIFRMRENASKSRNVDTQREATHFKNRVLDLVDTFLKNQPSSALVIRVLLPLVELSSISNADERQLADKAKGVLKRIAKSKDIPSNPDVEEVKLALTELHTRARKLHSSELLATLSQCSLYVARILIESGAQDAVATAYRDSLQDFMTRKNSALNNNFFLDAIRRHPSTIWALRNDILSLSGAAVNGYRKSQCLQLLQPLVTHTSPTENGKEIIDFMLSLRQALIQSLTDASEGKNSLTAAQVKDLLRLASFGVNFTQRIASAAEMRTAWDFDAWEVMGRKLGDSERFKSSIGLRKTCQKLATSQVATPSSKRKADTSGDISQSKKKKKTVT